MTTQFKTITQVSGHLNLPPHVLRFWESKFPQIQPLKRAGGRRYYRPDDIALISRIRDLLHYQGYTIRGVQQILETEKSTKYASNAWLPDGKVVAADGSNVAPLKQAEPQQWQQAESELRKELAAIREDIQALLGALA